MLDALIAAYNEAVFETDREAAFQIIDQALSQGMTAEDIVFKIVIPVAELMMARITQDPDANLAQHFMTAQIASAVTEKMLEKFQQPPELIGRVVNVPAERFVDEALAYDAQIIAISAMMVHTATSEHGCRKVRQILRERDLEKRLRIVVGGAPYRFDSEMYRRVGADAWAPDGISAGKVIVDLLREVGQ